jgi:hypothetical protein
VATDAEIKQWLSTQKYTADQRITPFQRLKSKYLPPAGVTTWGEWYELLGVTPPEPKKEEQKKPSGGGADSKSIERFQKELDTAQSAYDRFKSNNRDRKISLENSLKSAQRQLESAEKSKDSEKYNQASQAVQRYQRQLDSLQREEDTLLDNLNKAREIYNTERDLSQAERDIKFRQETNQPVSTADQERAENLRQQRNALRGQPEVPTTPSFGPPEVRGGRAVPGTGGGVTTPGPTGPTQQQPKAPTQPTQPTMQQTPQKPSTGGRGGAAGGTGGKGGKGAAEKPVDTFESVIEAAKGSYGGIDEVFRTNEELRNLLTKAVGKVDDLTDNYTQERFLSELENTNWWKSNAGPIRQRGFYKRQYDDLVNTLKTDDPNYQTKIAELNRTSEYGRGLANVIEDLRNQARTLGVQVDDSTLTIIAKNLYDYANESDATKIREALLGSGKFATGGIYTGQAGVNLRTLRDIAAANGLDFDKQFGTSKDTWLTRIAQGESIETFKDLIRKTAQNAWALDDRTRALLDQGVDLETIYSPFKKQMATTLELPEETITLNDLASKGVFGGEKPMTLYDFRKALRKDDRWQYTDGARTEMSALTENLLRDFGFVR